MPAKHFQISKSANKQIGKLPIRIQDKINKAFDRLKTDPLSGDKLHGELKGYYKYRLGDYRIIYSFDIGNNILSVVKIEHRQGVYK